MITLQDIRKNFNEEAVFSHISYNFPKQLITVLMGPSGCGKTTLIRMILGLDTEFSGSLVSRAKKTACCFQEDRLLEWESVLDNIRFVAPEVSEDEARSLLQHLQLENALYKSVKNLSGGQRQRAALARALLFDSDLFVADEPLSSLDHGLKDGAARFIRNYLKSKQRTAIYITHDPFEAAVVADRIALISEKPARITEVIDREHTAISAEELYRKLVKL